MSDFQDAFDQGSKASPVQEFSDRAFVAVPEGYELEDIEKYADRPRFKRGPVTLHRPASFALYVNAYKDANSLITADLASSSLTAILDYNEAGSGAPRWGMHKAVYQCRHTPEWQTWVGAHGVKKSQTDFANFLEDNLPDITSPAGADLLEMARSLVITKSANFRSDVRQSDGRVQLTYEEQIDGSASKGQMRIVDNFTLGLAPYEGSALWQVEARLRYRLTDGKLTLWVDLLRAHKVLEAAFSAIVDQVQKDCPDVRLVHGKVG